MAGLSDEAASSNPFSQGIKPAVADLSAPPRSRIQTLHEYIPALSSVVALRLPLLSKRPFQSNFQQVLP
jgi:hypothetical protein